MNATLRLEPSEIKSHSEYEGRHPWDGFFAGKTVDGIDPIVIKTNGFNPFEECTSFTLEFECTAKQLRGALEHHTFCNIREVETFHLLIEGDGKDYGRFIHNQMTPMPSGHDLITRKDQIKDNTTYHVTLNSMMHRVYIYAISKEEAV